MSMKDEREEFVNSILKKEEEKRAKCAQRYYEIKQKEKARKEAEEKARKEAEENARKER